jgi:hypothetical protein
MSLLLCCTPLCSMTQKFSNMFGFNGNLFKFFFFFFKNKIIFLKNLNLYIILHYRLNKILKILKFLIK